MATSSQNCWEFMGCPLNIRDACIVYELDMGKECWFMMLSKKGCPRSKILKNGCFDCAWYKKFNS
ncbi:MAG: hypothetical protein NT116_02855 [Candidatus Parcubacteria bacterium]|nr:hypothetical protein [Candidatus Parcubacteria bacterium]